MNNISVCIPAYNQARFIGACIHSVLNQRVLPIEIIVSDDCSNDGTQNILNELAAKTSLLKVIQQPVNKGIVANTNACLKMAAGDYIVRLDSDDVLYADYLAELSGLLSANPAAAYAHCGVNEIDAYGNYIRTRTLFRQQVYEDDSTTLQKALKGYRVAANIIMFRREALEKVGYLLCPYNFAEDYYVTGSMAAQGYGNVYCPRILAGYRVWRHQGEIPAKKKIEEIKGLTAVFDEVLQPAFKEKQYSAQSVKSARQRFARQQADSLAWPAYTICEKKELKAALLQLSSSANARLTYYLYEHNLRFLPQAIQKIKAAIRELVKRFWQKLLHRQ